MRYAVLCRGWSLGKKVAIAGTAITSVPMVIPPLVILSTLGLVAAFPVGVYLASFAFTDKVMRYLLPIPLSSEEQHGEEEVMEEGDGNEEEVGMEKQEKPVYEMGKKKESMGVSAAPERVEVLPSSDTTLVDAEMVREEKPEEELETQEERDEETGGVYEEHAGAVVPVVEKAGAEGEIKLVAEETPEEDVEIGKERGEEGEGKGEDLLASAVAPEDDTRLLKVTGMEEIRNQEVAGMVKKEKPIEETSKEDVREDKEVEKDEGVGATAFDGEAVAYGIRSLVAVVPVVHEPSDLGFEKQSGEREEEKQMHEMGVAEEGELEQKVKVEKVAASETEEPTTEGIMMVEGERPNEDKVRAEERDVEEKRKECKGKVAITPESEESSGDNFMAVALVGQKSEMKENGERGEEKQMQEIGVAEEGELEQKVKVEEAAISESEEPSTEGIMMVEGEGPNEEKVRAEERDVEEERKECKGKVAITLESEESSGDNSMAVAFVGQESEMKENGEREEEKQMHEMGVAEGELEQKVKVEEVATSENEEPSTEGIMMVEGEGLNEEKVRTEERDVEEERKECEGKVAITLESEESSGDYFMAVAFEGQKFEVKPSSLTVDYSSVVVENGNGGHCKIVEEERVVEETRIKEEKEAVREVENEVKDVHAAREGEPLQSALVAVVHVACEIGIEPSSLSSGYASAVEDQSSDMVDTESQCSVKHVVDITPGPNSVVAEVKAGVSSNDEILYSEEELWEQIKAMRTIVGYEAGLHSSYAEEIRALYLFTGVEAHHSFSESSDLMEANDKLRFLKSVIGVK